MIVSLCIQFKEVLYSYVIPYLIIAVVEMGDDIQKIVNDKALMLINHQSTSDVPLIMAALDGRSRNIMWIMDRMFMKTNFGVVSWFHKDFFISSVCSHHSHRSKQPYMH